MGTKNCPACKTSNPTKARFCFSCGEAFNILCTDCGEENPGKSKFCMSCGSSLKGAPKKEKINAPTKKQKANSSSKSPKKSDKVQIVSVLFADIKGFTSISEKLKPDQVKFLMDHILKELTLCIEAEDGYVDKYIGDAIMAIFGGYKPTKEDAENAIRSAINMQKKIDELSNIFMILNLE